jgi:hypothetical protein
VCNLLCGTFAKLPYTVCTSVHTYTNVMKTFGLLIPGEFDDGRFFGSFSISSTSLSGRAP